MVTLCCSSYKAKVALFSRGDLVGLLRVGMAGRAARSHTVPLVMTLCHTGLWHLPGASMGTRTQVLVLLLHTQNQIVLV